MKEAIGTMRGGKDGARPFGALFIPLAMSAAIIATPVSAQSGAQQDSVGEDAVDAVTQPLSDLNLRSKDIPPILLRAQQTPYYLGELDSCAALYGEIGQLDGVMGPDADAPAENEGLFNKGLQLGGKILGGLIPFRGVVRQLSGAEAEETKWETAIYAGVARRSYLKGYAFGLDCGSVEGTKLSAPREIIDYDPSLVPVVEVPSATLPTPEWIYSFERSRAIAVAPPAVVPVAPAWLKDGRSSN